MRYYGPNIRNLRMKVVKYLKNTRVVVLLLLVVLIVIILLPWRHSCILIDYVPADLIPNHVLKIKPYKNSSKLCAVFSQDPFLPPFPIDNPKVDERDLESLSSKLGIVNGGNYAPTECFSQIRVAIIVPYRERPEQLSLFLLYMHHFLAYQRLNYTVFVVEQTFTKDFNRGKLFNVGFKEAMKLGHVDCFIFHDVDLLPEDGSNVYACAQHPRHLITALNSFNYNLPYCDIFGGAVAFTSEQYTKVNGFGNNFYGWGGEDDNLSERVQASGYKIMRWDPKIARYSMLLHEKAIPNINRFDLMKEAIESHQTDGLNNVKYVRRLYEQRPLYTWILVDL